MGSKRSSRRSRSSRGSRKSTPLSAATYECRAGGRGRASRRSARRRGNAAKSGWVSGRRPSHAEIWESGKPIVISRAGSQWSLSVMGAPLVRTSAGGLSFRGRVDFEEGAPPAKFKKKDDVKFIAHKIGHYMLNLGDFVDTYTDGY